jgi:hypothetical protein
LKLLGPRSSDFDKGTLYVCMSCMHEHVTTKPLCTVI